MEILKEIRSPRISQKLLERINKKLDVNISIMEVCGTHTNSILKSGIKELLPDNIRLISGPGCPVCVTPQGYIDTAIEISKRRDIIITTFGDLMRVPGSTSTLNREKAVGSDIRVVYSPLDSLKIAEDNKDKKVVFLSIGFETTAPIIALSISLATKRNINNYFILNALKTMPEAMSSLILNPQVKVDGFLCPGHVATITGEDDFKEIALSYKIPMVIAGFEVNDILSAILELIYMKENSSFEVRNLYSRLVKSEGNVEALKILYNIFEKGDSSWRGLGKIHNAGLKLKSKYRSFDILDKLDIQMIEEESNRGCSCGEILMGIKEPQECKLFKTVCTPLNPIGACMVSEEGACSAFYKYFNE